MSAFQPDVQPVRISAPITDVRALAFSGSGAALRVANLRRALDQALVQWWQRGALPASSLVRDGLLALEAGHDLDDAQRSLLLRAALAHRQGMITALRHQDDPDRTALLLRDALLVPIDPLPLSTFARLGLEDDQSEAWIGALCQSLRQEAADADPARGRRAAALLSQVEDRTWAEIAQAQQMEPVWQASLLQPRVLILLGALAVIVVAIAAGFWLSTR